MDQTIANQNTIVMMIGLILFAIVIMIVIRWFPNWRAARVQKKLEAEESARGAEGPPATEATKTDQKVDSDWSWTQIMSAGGITIVLLTVALSIYAYMTGKSAGDLIEMVPVLNALVLTGAVLFGGGAVVGAHEYVWVQKKKVWSLRFFILLAVICLSTFIGYLALTGDGLRAVVEIIHAKRGASVKPLVAVAEGLKDGTVKVEDVSLTDLLLPDLPTWWNWWWVGGVAGTLFFLWVIYLTKGKVMEGMWWPMALLIGISAFLYFNDKSPPELKNARWDIKTQSFYPVGTKPPSEKAMAVVVATPVATYDNGIAGDLPDIVAEDKPRQAIFFGKNEEGLYRCFSHGAPANLARYAKYKEGPWHEVHRGDDEYMGFVSGAEGRTRRITNIKRLTIAKCN